MQRDATFVYTSITRQLFDRISPQKSNNGVAPGFTVYFPWTLYFTPALAMPRPPADTHCPPQNRP